MNKILFLPLDERPCNYIFPNKLVKMTSDFELCSPGYEILGKKKTPSNFEALRKYLLDHASECDNAVISLDQLLYGGIIPSRLHYLSSEELLDRLNVIKEIKKINPKIKIYAFILIMRCPRYSSSDEEPDYYEQYGEQIFEYGVHYHKGEENCNHDEKFIEAVNDYIKRRKVNLSLIKKVIEYINDYLDYLVIPQDDSAPYGFTMMDRLEILDMLKSIDKSKYEIYPGADEVGMTLIARAILKQLNISKKIYLDCMFDDCLKMVPAYENKELGDTISHQINAAGATLTSDINDADIILYLDYAADKQYEVVNASNYTFDKAKALKQIIRIKNNLNHKTCSLVDKTFVNGGNIDYLKLLNQELDFINLDFYAGWNTSSNTLGTVISGSIIVNIYGSTINSKKFIVERLYDDAIYQGIIRKDVCDNDLPSMGLNYFHVDGTNGKVSQIITDKLTLTMKEKFNNIYKEFPKIKVSQPWSRMFETNVEVIK